MKRFIVSTLVATALVLGTAGVASASTGGNYGQHVATCAKTHGFSGDMNPGMHHGAAGWTGDSCSA